MKTRKFIMLCIGFIFGIFLFSTNSYAGSQNWKSLDYDVTVNEDGSMDVIETWNIHISETNTLFKDFELDSSKYSGITNVEVIQVSPTTKKLDQIFEEQYHVDPDCFYALKTKYSTFEIAWNVGLDNSSANRVYEIHYTIEDAVKIYDDCTELYWMFLDTSNEISGRNITGTIKLPTEVDDIDSLRVWGHGPLNADIQKESNDTITFSCNSLPKNTMLEVRIVTEENIYPLSTKILSTNRLKYILEQEQEWADEANAKRDKNRKIFVTIFLIITIFFIFFLFKIIKYIKEGKELKSKYNKIQNNLKYFRNIPNEKNATPGIASYLYYLKNNNSNMENNLSKIFSATILDLSLRGYIEFEPIDKKDMKIILKKNMDEEKLPIDEKSIYKLIKKACNSNDEITIKEFKKYANKNYDSVYTTIKLLKSKVIGILRVDKILDEEKEKLYKKYRNKGTMYFYILLVNICIPIAILTVRILAVPILIELLICAILCFSNSKKFSILTEIGEEQEKQWKALKNYMDDFSLLKEKEVPDLILWEKYLVYATAFGISKKVVDQLKVIYPEMLNPNYYSNYNYHYMYFMCDTRFGNDFIGSFDRMVGSVYNSASSAYSSAHSSGSGGGGGFSGGGGGRRRRRTVAGGR